MKYSHQILLGPMVTEKSMILRDYYNQYVVEVNPGANKIEIAKAIEKEFSVKVLSVRTINMFGKKKRRGRTSGKRADWKKAFIKLAPGSSIKYFEGA